MKKWLIFIFIIPFLMGCSSSLNDDAINNFVNNVKKSKSYELKGIMEIQNDEEVFGYDVNVKYLKDNYYVVNLENKTTNQVQVILRNNDGLYVITPALNKSFKFDSTWPDNSSQAYILSSLVKDINNDKDTTVKQENDNYIIKSKVSYPNNKELKYQKIYLDKSYNLKAVEVYSDADIVKIKIDFKSVDLKQKNKKEDFKLENYISDVECDDCKSKSSMKIENAIYPLYTPSNTYLSSSEVVNGDLDSRIILSFSGDKNFVLVEETSLINDEHEVIPVYGEPVMLNDTIGAMSTSSMYWTSNNIDYYLASDDLSVDEMVFIATSLNNAKATIAEK